MKRLKKSCGLLFAMIMMLFPVLTACDFNNNNNNNSNETPTKSNATIAEETLQAVNKNSYAKKYYNVECWTGEDAGEYSLYFSSNVDNDGSSVKEHCFYYPNDLSKREESYVEWLKTETEFKKATYNLSKKSYKTTDADLYDFYKSSNSNINYYGTFNALKKFVEAEQLKYIYEETKFKKFVSPKISQTEHDDYTIVKILYKYYTEETSPSKELVEHDCEYLIYVKGGLIRAVYFMDNKSVTRYEGSTAQPSVLETEKIKYLYTYYDKSKITFEKIGYDLES